MPFDFPIPGCAKVFYQRPPTGKLCAKRAKGADRAAGREVTFYRFFDPLRAYSAKENVSCLR